MAEFITKCPHCNAELQAQDEWVGMDAECLQCNQNFVIKKQNSIAPVRMSASNLNKKKKSSPNCSTQNTVSKCFFQQGGRRRALMLVGLLFISFAMLALSGINCSNTDTGSLSTSETSHSNTDTGSLSASETSHSNTDTGSLSASETSYSNTGSDSSQEKNLPKLEFLGISVNESEEIIKEHLLKKGWMLESSPPEEKLHIGKEVLSGKFWLLNAPSNIAIKAHVSFDSGRIMVTFDDLNASSTKILMKLADNRYEFQNNLKKYNSILARENILMKQYFATLKGKYNLSQAENSINLEDGLIEFRSKYTHQIKGVYFIGTPDQYNCVIFYNRQAAKKRLQENRKKLDDLNRRSNDI